MTAVRTYRVRIGDIDWKVRSLGTRTGEAPPIVMVPGLGAGNYLLPHARELAGARQVLVPDMPGFGRTRGPERLRSVDQFADALLAFIAVEAGGVADLIGNSFGTQIVLAAAQRAPDAVRRVVLIGPTFDAKARTFPRVLGRWLRIATKEPPSLALSLLYSYAQCGVRTPWLALRAGLDDAPEQRIAYVPHPILLIRGCDDWIAPAEWVRQLAVLAARAEVAEVPDTAHTVDYAAPRSAAELTRAFLGS